MQSNTELYEVVEKIINLLEKNKESQWAFKLKSAMYSDSTAGEVLGKIRLSLLELQKTDLPKKLALENEIQISLAYIDKIWRKTTWFGSDLFTS